MFAAIVSAVGNFLTEIVHSAVAFGVAMAINYITQQFQ
jgi:hypothetical protein